MEASLREDQMMDSTTRRTEVRCLIGQPAGRWPPCRRTELVRSGVVSRATTAASTVSIRVLSSRTSRPTPGAGGVHEGTGNPSLSF